METHNPDAAGAIGALVGIVCYLLFIFVILAFIFICRYKIFIKAGQQGIHALIPYYGTYILTTKIAGKDDMMFILSIIPFISIYGRVMTNLALAKSFGKDDGYGIGLSFLPIVFLPMLAFDKKTVYIGPGGVAENKDSSNSLTNNWQDGSNTPPTV